MPPNGNGMEVASACYSKESSSMRVLRRSKQFQFQKLPRKQNGFLTEMGNTNIVSVILISKRISHLNSN